MSDKSSLKRLQIFNFKLNALLEITQAINSNLPVPELLQRYQNILQENLTIGRIVIFKFQNGWDIILNSSNDATAQEIDIEKDLIPFTEIQFLSGSGTESLRNYDFAIPIYNNNKPLAFILIGDIDEMEGVSPVIKHLHYIQTISNIIIVAIENIRLFNDSLKQEAMKREMELASRMQNMLVPKKENLPKNNRMMLTSFYQPHFEVGGDYFDYIDMGKNEFGFCIADVSGKGISAALLMSNFQASLRAIFVHETPLKVIVERLNERVSASANFEKFITFFIGRYNFETKLLDYINAGHNPPILYDTYNKSITHLKSGCIGLGMLDFIPNIQQGQYTVTGNTKMLCFTDGLVEFLDDTDISVTTRLLEGEMSNENTIEENIESIIQNLSINESNTAIFDDVTMLGVQLF